MLFGSENRFCLGKNDIDFILQYQGDNFSRIPVKRHFSIDKLPKFVKIHDHIFEVQKIGIMLMFLKTFLICLFIIIL